MRGPDIAKKLAKSFEHLAVASRKKARCVFVVPIADVLLGLCIDRTSRASENILRPFALPLAFGEVNITLAKFDIRNMRFNPQEKDSAEQARVLIQKHIIPWLSVRRTLDDLLANTPPPAKGDDYHPSTHVYISEPEVADYAKLLCLVDRIDDARQLIDEFTHEFQRHGTDRSVDRYWYKHLQVLRSAVVDGSKETAAEYWRKARKRTLGALRIDPAYLAKHADG